MKIQYFHPNELIPYERNSKQHPERQIKALAEVIKQLGFDQPIVVDQNMVIIKGHGRRLASLLLGLDSVPVVVREISATEAKFMRVADNESPSGEWDAHALRSEVRSLSTSGLDLTLTGFEMAELEMIMTDIPAQGAGDIEIPPLKTTHECGKCNYKW